MMVRVMEKGTGSFFYSSDTHSFDTIPFRQFFGSKSFAGAAGILERSGRKCSWRDCGPKRGKCTGHDDHFFENAKPLYYAGKTEFSRR
jgi:hypothetical protein